MEEEWKKYGYPGPFKFYHIMKKKNPNVKFQEIDDFVNQKKTYQLHKKIRKQIQGHIVAYRENALWFMDLLDMGNYSRKNKGYKWILLAIDTFTRKAYASPLKNKTKFEVKRGFQDMYDSEKDITLIITDSGSEFLNAPVQDLLKELKIKHDTVDVGDHNALGLIDRLSRTIKEIIFKDFTERNSVVWYDRLDDYLHAYNERPHRGILNFAPNEVNEHATEIVELNTIKSMPVEHKFKVGDLVRKKLSKPVFNKGYKQIWSLRSYTIKNIVGIHAVLSNDDKVRLDKLQIIKNDELSGDDDEVKKSDREAQIEKIIKHREGLDTSNVINKRLRQKSK